MAGAEDHKESGTDNSLKMFAMAGDKGNRWPFFLLTGVHFTWNGFPCTRSGLFLQRRAQSLFNGYAGEWVHGHMYRRNQLFFL